MKRVDIDFAAPGLWRTLFRTPPALWAALYLGLGLSVATALLATTYLNEQRVYEAQADLQQRRAHASAATPVALRQVAVPEAQAKAVNAAILQLNLPWGALRDTMQAATPASIALLALEPDARKRALRITAEARGSDEMIGYVEALQRQDLFTSVTLLRHEINDQDKNHPIRFQLDAQWRTP
jgi:Tfp pilus assembly protein PilN